MSDLKIEHSQIRTAVQMLQRVTVLLAYGKNQTPTERAEAHALTVQAIGRLNDALGAMSGFTVVLVPESDPATCHHSIARTPEQAAIDVAADHLPRREIVDVLVFPGRLDDLIGAGADDLCARLSGREVAS